MSDMAIAEHDVVRLTGPVGMGRDAPFGGEAWPSGTKGTVVSEPANGAALVEISDESGATLGLVNVSLKQLEVVGT